MKKYSLKQSFRSVFREYDTFLHLKLMQTRLREPLPICEIFGLPQTSGGMGMLVEKARDSEGNTGPTVQNLHENGKLTAEHVNLLNDFARKADRWNLIINDMNPKNLVLHTASEKPRFMLVDGFGDANFIPTKTWFRFLRTRARDRKFAKLTDFLGMAWDKEKRCIVSG